MRCDLQFLANWCSSREASIEVALAIAELAKNEKEMERIWDDPSPEEIKTVSKRALHISGGEEDLHWGIEKVRCDEWRKAE